jgi:WhiB family redox-sensing transcriptional regulator
MVRTMSVLFSELLLPGWAEGPNAMMGINELADASANLPCHSVDPEVFFAETKPEISYAKALCGECPMKAKCLSGALSRKEPTGVWGGELFEDGKVITEKRAPGRPRINSVVKDAEVKEINVEIVEETILAKKIA